jgi:hypothetical protein
MVGHDTLEGGAPPAADRRVKCSVCRGFPIPCDACGGSGREPLLHHEIEPRTPVRFFRKRKPRTSRIHPDVAAALGIELQAEARKRKRKTTGTHPAVAAAHYLRVDGRRPITPCYKYLKTPVRVTSDPDQVTCKVCLKWLFDLGPNAEPCYDCGLAHPPFVAVRR